ncbi:MAG: hypothetical protein DYG94_04365 [Leptolyngbya sp. PLA3]|nr:MAG: hypothetical protein EDM82_07530 [Cyanobacteria bacterium CYA]MCE7967965.1 hypothetical protein [Leptolyngbya sp. PL-A3]
MFCKLLAIIIAIGLTACGLLSMRQARLQAVHELADAQLRIWRHDERLLLLRAKIAQRITPDGVREMLARCADLPELIDAADAGWVSLPDEAPVDPWARRPEQHP